MHVFRASPHSPSAPAAALAGTHERVSGSFSLRGVKMYHGASLRLTTVSLALDRATVVASARAYAPRVGVGILLIRTDAYQVNFSIFKKNERGGTERKESGNFQSTTYG
jgi:hypothetical protein